MKVLLTGATGFLGTHLTNKLLENGWDIFSLQRGGGLSHPRVKTLYHDFRAEIPGYILRQLEGVSHIVHLGAEVHGLRSLADPELFVHTNTVGTFNILEACRKLSPQKFIYMSSADTIGPAEPGVYHDENCALNPSSPYAASKAAGEVLVQSYARSFGVPGIIVRPMNMFGEGQTTGQFVPDVIKKILNGEEVLFHVGKDWQPSSRQWIHVREIVSALGFLMMDGQVGEVYHIQGTEKTSAQIIDLIGYSLHVPFRMRSTVPGRAHDMRHAIKDTKLQTKAYRSDIFAPDLEATTQWYKKNQDFLQ